MVEGTPLLRVQAGNRLEGSNPFHSAIFPKRTYLQIQLQPDFLVVFECYVSEAVHQSLYREASYCSLTPVFLRG